MIINKTNKYALLSAICVLCVNVVLDHIGLVDLNKTILFDIAVGVTCLVYGLAYDESIRVAYNISSGKWSKPKTIFVVSTFTFAVLAVTVTIVALMPRTPETWGFGVAVGFTAALLRAINKPLK